MYIDMTHLGELGLHPADDTFPRFTLNEHLTKYAKDTCGGSDDEYEYEP